MRAGRTAPRWRVLFGLARDASASLVVSGLRAYQVGLAPITGGTCRFVPSCSEYAVDAVSAHGPVRGLWLSLRRIARCHPFGGHGLDPVPDHGGHPCGTRQSSGGHGSHRAVAGR